MNGLFTDIEIHGAVGGEITNKGWSVTGISIDSRTILEGELFLAIVSKRDGHDFVLSAIENGASAAIVTRMPFGVPKGFPCIVVGDSQKALNDLAFYARQRFRGRLVAITGSVGKTSTKELLTSVLSKFGKTHCSPKSYNNYLGVPLTLVNIPKDAQYVVCEIGMNDSGEIEPLSKLSVPDIAIITNISVAHLAAFEDIQGIAKEKSMICTGLGKSGLFIFPSETSFQKTILKTLKREKVRGLTFGSHDSDCIFLKKVSFKNNRTLISAVLKDVANLDFELDALGFHHASNCLPVLGVIEEFRINLKLAVKYIENWKPMAGRGETLDVKLKKGSHNINIKIIDESYNCNPTSLEASLEVVKHLNFNKDLVWNRKAFRRIAILGDMLELGLQEKKFHQDIASMNSINCFDLIHCIGSLMAFLHEELPASKRGLAVKSPNELIPYLMDQMQDKDVYMIKGSNSIGLSEIVTELCNLNGHTILR